MFVFDFNMPFARENAGVIYLYHVSMLNIMKTFSQLLPCHPTYKQNPYHLIFILYYLK